MSVIVEGAAGELEITALVSSIEPNCTLLGFEGIGAATPLLTTTGSFSVVDVGCSEEDIAALGRLECDGCPFTRGVPVA
jgi:hypothetical protein